MVDRYTSYPPSADTDILKSILRDPGKPARGGFLFRRHIEVYDKLMRRRGGLYADPPSLPARLLRRLAYWLGVGKEHSWKQIPLELSPVFYCDRCTLMLSGSFMAETPRSCSESMDLVLDEAAVAEVMES